MNSKSNIKILVVDDHAITRNGIKTLLSVYDDMDLAGEASNGREAVKACKDLRPDIVLMDMDMPILNGIEATKSIKGYDPNIKIIALSSFSDKKYVSEAIKAGATSYILKNISPAEIVKTIRDAYIGKANLSPEVTQTVMDEISSPTTGKSSLTEQELRILGLIVKGYSNKDIAKEIYISDHTVKFHISNILNKLGASNRAEAAVIATKNHFF